MSTNELVSVIVPTYRSKYLEECLDSILQQTYESIEIIIVDDHSNDTTLNIIGSYAKRYRNIRYVANETNEGVGASRNRGISIAQGKYIAFLDHDDLWEPSKLELQVKCLTDNPDVGAVYCYCRFLNSDNDINRHISSSTTEDLLIHGAVFCMPGSVLIRAETIRQAGLFPHEREISEDLALWLEVSTLTEFSCLPRPLYVRRKHSNQLSSQRTGVCDELAVHRFLDRHVVDSTLRNRAEQALLMRRAFSYRAERKLVLSCYAFLRAWLKSPFEAEALKSLLVNLARWKAVTRTAQKWVSTPKETDAPAGRIDR